MWSLHRVGSPSAAGCDCSIPTAMDRRQGHAQHRHPSRAAANGWRSSTVTVSGTSAEVRETHDENLRRSWKRQGRLTNSRERYPCWGHRRQRRARSRCRPVWDEWTRPHAQGALTSNRTPRRASAPAVAGVSPLSPMSDIRRTHSNTRLPFSAPPAIEVGARSSRGVGRHASRRPPDPTSYYDWLKKPFSMSSARSSAEISTLRGVSMKTLSAIRCMPPSSA